MHQTEDFDAYCRYAEEAEQALGHPIEPLLNADEFTERVEGMDPTQRATFLQRMQQGFTNTVSIAIRRRQELQEAMEHGAPIPSFIEDDIRRAPRP